MNPASALLVLTAETSLHAGSGQSAAGIDLPIQREVHTKWPCVYGSAVKGAMRARAFWHNEAADSKLDIVDLFGPEPGAAAGERDASHAGAVQIGDARLMLLPVRSLNTCFRWVTSPAVLRRLARDAERQGLAKLDVSQLNPGREQALVAEDVAKGNLFLEEFRLQASTHAAVQQLASRLAELTGYDPAVMSTRLSVVHDDVLAFLSEHATAINAHIAIDAKTKTVKDGALWYEETLPPETVLYVPVNATASRRKVKTEEGLKPRAAAEVLTELLSLFGPGQQWLQLGGNETTGMGWCQVHIHRATEQAGGAK